MPIEKIQMSELLSVYGRLLTDNQRDVLCMYCDCDCTLSEIAVEKGITRQGVRDAILKGENTLTQLESNLHIAEFLRELDRALQQGDDDKVLQLAKKFVGKE